DTSITRQTGQKLNRAIIGTLSLAVLVLLARQFWPHAAIPTKTESAAPSPASDKSIAVLPFANLSDDKANAYFAVGIQDEILTKLAKVGALKVISRTSTQRYASSPDNLPQIARELGVANILEGSVQKAGDAVHINVQLIRAAGDEHLWAESYNRKLDDMFGVEGEVAQTVAETLKAKLSGAEQQAVATSPTQVPAAYEAYARGRALDSGSYDIASHLQALAAYQEAARLDPRFALAQAHAAIVASFLYFNGVDTEHVTSALIQQAADTALQLQPELGEGLLARGCYKYRVLRSYPAALEDFKAAQQRLPNNAEALNTQAAVERRLGRWDDAVAHAQAARALDPRNMQVLLTNAIELYNYLRRFDDARHALDQALEIQPDSVSAYSARATIEQDDGKLEAAAAWVAKLPQHYSADDYFIGAPLVQLLWERRWDRAAAFARDALPAGDGPLPLDDALWVALMLGQAQQRGGHAAEARATFSRIVRSIKPTPDAAVRIDESRSLEYLAMAYAGLGDKRAALDTAAQAVAAYRDDALTRPDVEVTLAQVQAQVGELEPAIAALPHLLQVPAGLTLGQLKLDPLFDPVRGDPRVQKLLDGHS
ncbi:MAG: tetratricopeptide repeat protein, partial [Nevskia sp.]|nr:tetratricopeptide repeat protein [Nevskia sp.]